MRETYKDVTISGQSFRIGRLNPLDGVWVLQVLLTRLLPIYIRLKVESGEFKQDSQLELMSPAQSRDLQRIMLSACRELKRVEDNDTYLPISNAEDIVSETVKNDLILAVTLTIESLMFNVVTPFFSGKGALESLMETVPGTTSNLKT